MKSLSNIIKSRYVYLNEIDRKMIDTNERSEEFRVIHLQQYAAKSKSSHKSLFSSLEKDSSHPPDSLDGDFTEGIAAALVEDGTSNEMELTEYASKEYSDIIKKAREDAERILSEAREEAEKNKEALYMEAKEAGFRDGMKEAQQEIIKAQQRADEFCEAYKSKIDRQIEELEPEFANVVALLVEKMTGVLVEDRRDIILYLIHNAMNQSYNHKSYLIKVSKEDYEFVLSKKQELTDLISGDISLEIIKDNELTKNQCMIETDTSVIDCSLDMQLHRLTEDIKLLSVIRE